MFQTTARTASWQRTSKTVLRKYCQCLAADQKMLHWLPMRSKHFGSLGSMPQPLPILTMS